MGADLGAWALTEARLWRGTPYLHQASQRGIGCDCLGLVRGIWRALYGAEPEDLPAYTCDWGEAAGREILWLAAGRLMQPKVLAEAAPGDLLLFRMQRGAIAKHLGVQGELGPGASFLHAYSGHGVVESPLSQPWQRRLVARFGWPAGADQIEKG